MAGILTLKTALRFFITINNGNFIVKEFFFKERKFSFTIINSEEDIFLNKNIFEKYEILRNTFG